MIINSFYYIYIYVVKRIYYFSVFRDITWYFASFLKFIRFFEIFNIFQVEGWFWLFWLILVSSTIGGRLECFFRMCYHMFPWVTILITTHATIRLWEFCSISNALQLLVHFQMCYCVPYRTFKACVRYFLSQFYFSLNNSPSKTMKNFLFHLKSSFRSRDIQIFVFLSSPLFSPVSHCFRGWWKITLKFYNVINCPNKNLITHLVWYGTFLWKSHAENVHQRLVPDSFLILVNSPKQPLDVRNSFKNRIFWKKIIKKL